jgi:tryptophanyl-tRNA synthetase
MKSKQPVSGIVGIASARKQESPFSMSDSSKPPEPTISLQERRRQHNQKVAQTFKDPDTRIRELEEDQLRLIDMALDQEQRIENLEKRLIKMLHLLQGKG